jgi:hypothetical protein
MKKIVADGLGLIGLLAVLYVWYILIWAITTGP